MNYNSLPEDNFLPGDNFQDADTTIVLKSEIEQNVYTDPDTTIVEEPSERLKNKLGATAQFDSLKNSIKNFEKNIKQGSAIGITVVNFIYYAEVRLRKVTLHETGEVSFHGLDKNNRKVSFFDRGNNLAFALSELPNPKNYENSVEFDYVE